MIWALSLTTVKLCPHGLTTGLYNNGIRSLFGLSNCEGTKDHSVLYPHYLQPALPLKAFRGEPAITKLDKLFTSNHSSSDDIAQSNSSDLHPPFGGFHPGHG